MFSTANEPTKSGLFFRAEVQFYLEPCLIHVTNINSNAMGNEWRMKVNCPDHRGTEVLHA